jgi:hypothetical protein
MAAVGNVMYHSLYETNRDLYDAIMGGIHRQQAIITWQKNCIRHFELNLRLSQEVMNALDALINQNTVAGSRYNDQNSVEVDTENFTH